MSGMWTGDWRRCRGGHLRERESFGACGQANSSHTGGADAYRRAARDAASCGCVGAFFR